MTAETARPTEGRGQRLYRRAKQRIPGGTQLLSKRPELFLPEQWPAYFSRAKGAEVWDLEGRRLLDMSHNSVGTCPLGYADDSVDAKVKEAIDHGTMSTLNCPEEVELAELLCEIHPWAQKVRLARTGGEIMAIAIRVARAATGRDVVAFCGYHGWHDWYLAANLAGDSLGGPGLLLPGLEPRGVPSGLRGSARIFHFNQLEELEALVDSVGDRLAAIVCEPRRSEAPHPGFLPGVVRLAHRVGAVAIFDEITSGFRLNLGGAHLLEGVEPDLCTLGKGLGNGYPIACLIGRDEVMDAAQQSFVSSTFWSERIGPVAALATIRRFQETQAHERLIAVGNRVQALWREAAQDAGLAVHVGPEAMPPLSHLRFEHPAARAVQTLWCQTALDRGVLDNGACYATCGHDDGILEEYGQRLHEIAHTVGRAVTEDRVADALRGPVGHSGFARLT